MKLNEREIFILLEALESWEGEPISNSLRSAMLGTMLEVIVKDSDDKTKGTLKKQIATSKVEAEVEHLSRRKESILLKAKILSAGDE